MDNKPNAMLADMLALEQLRTLRRNSPEGWDRAYKERHQQLESEFSDRVATARSADIADAREYRTQLDDWALGAQAIIRSRWDGLNRRADALRQVGEDLENRSRRMQGLEPLGVEQPDPKASHLDDVTDAVRAAVEATDDESV